MKEMERKRKRIGGFFRGIGLLTLFGLTAGFFGGSLIVLYVAYVATQLPPPEQRFPHEGKADPFNPCDHPESRRWQGPTV